MEIKCLHDLSWSIENCATSVRSGLFPQPVNLSHPAGRRNAAFVKTTENQRKEGMAARLIMNIVIAGGNQNTPYKAPVGATQSFNINVEGGNVSTCWYVPIDNIGDLTKFNHIEVGPGPEANQITLTINPAANALLRIFIYGDG
jgi:hypothetical protein